ncbi:hypothetical protein SAMN05892883_3594 [Jatrophihabitans sp. GAS493]|uniref:TIGR01777 family oxidoreductase n=1 Tax=Jatrophihabitans sp. GAS493 TaxID=1907575 RepID=UPI000BB93A5B|nr:TIGR01777 family oxidoreductase [Jatrophihabitans sp. GAS493]SOD74410.1 hypothetical protein SAMN05892883_3594 [Jatrophihabitans sp. GAS493]
MKVLLAGASGAIGTALSRSLVQHGHVIRTLVRRPASGSTEVTWRPDRGELDQAALNGIDAVICLSGAGVAEKRWTDEYKQVMRSSRIDSVCTLARAITETATPPKVFLSASAVGYYGDAGAAAIDESAPAGDGFLAGLCVDWEAATAPAEAAGVRVAHLRTGLVLDASTGLLAKLAPLYRFGLGGKLGSGEQYWPWISLVDEIASIEHLLTSEVHGGVNLTGPAPVTNADFSATLGRVLHRPAVLPVPGFALRAALGEFSSDVLTGQRALPVKLKASGFAFRHSTLTEALTTSLGRAQTRV